MEYTPRTVRSRPGLTQEEALVALQSHPSYRHGTRIASIRRRGDRWVADLLEPKFAAEDDFGPAGDDDADDAPAPKPKKEKSEGGDSEGGGDSDPAAELEDALDGPPGLPGGDPTDPEGGKPEGGKGGTEQAVLHVLEQILHALQGGPPSGGLGGPDDLGPGLGGPEGPPPPHAGPGRPPGAPNKPPMGGPGGPEGLPAGPGAGRPMRPGEMPNKPGVTPVGAPAFASTQVLAQKVAHAVQTRRRSFSIGTPVGLPVQEAAQAISQVCRPHGYKIAQMVPNGNRMQVLLVHESR